MAVHLARGWSVRAWIRSVTAGLGWAQISLAASFVNTAVVSFELHVSFPVSVVVFFVYVPRSRIAESLVLFLIFSTTVSCIVAAPIYIPTSSVGAVLLIHILISAYCLFEDSQ